MPYSRNISYKTLTLVLGKCLSIYYPIFCPQLNETLRGKYTDASRALFGSLGAIPGYCEVWRENKLITMCV